MLNPGAIEIRAVTRWNGRQIEARQYVPEGAWQDAGVRPYVRRALRLALAETIAETLTVDFEIRGWDPFALSGEDQDPEGR